MRVEDYKFSSGILVAICFTMDGHYRGSIRVWNVDTAQLVSTLLYFYYYFTALLH